MELDEYRRMAEAGDDHWWYRSTRALLEELLDPYMVAADTRTIHLDAGGGTGATGSWLAARAPTVLDDSEPLALSFVMDRVPGYQPVRCDINHIPHRSNSFDVSLCVTALCHRFNPDPQIVVDELARVTKPGGLVCLMEPGVRRMRRGHDVVTQTARRFSLGDIRTLIDNSGLDLLRATGAYSFLVPPAAMMAVFERGAPSSDVGRNESGLLGVMAGLARIERTVLGRFDLPFGLSVVAIGRKPA